MNKKSIKYLAFLPMLLLFVLTSCKKEDSNRGQMKEGISAGLTYVKPEVEGINRLGTLNFTGELVSMDDIENVDAYLVEVLRVDSYGNPTSTGNKFYIGSNSFSNKKNNSILDGTTEVVYLGEKNFKSGYKNKHSAYTVTGSVDLSKHRLIEGKRYLLSLNFVTVAKMPCLESPMLFVAQ